MPSSQPLDESMILSRFLLQPSSLPTILPYKSFLNLLPTSVRNDANLQRPIRKIYNDLQFQRSIDVDNVRTNIERECAKSGNIKARLRKALAHETDGDIDEQEGMIVDMTKQSNSTDGKTRKRRRSSSRERTHDSPELEMSRKRKRSVARASDQQNEGEDNDDNEAQSKRNTRSQSRRASSTADSAEHDLKPRQPNDEATSDDDDADNSSNASDLSNEEEIPESPTSHPPSSAYDSSSALLSPLSSSPPPSPGPDQKAFDALLDHTFHGPRGLALPSSYTSKQPQSMYHTRASLLAAMESAVKALEGEAEALEGEAREAMGRMRETVGGLSDLRYGKSLAGREGEGVTGLEGSVEEGLRGLSEVMGGGGGGGGE